jgi:hypothetical protein
VLLCIFLLLGVLLFISLYSRVAKSDDRSYSLFHLGISVPKEFEVDNSKSPRNDGTLALKEPGGGTITVSAVASPENGGSSLETLKFNGTNSATGILKNVETKTFTLQSSEVLEIDSSKLDQGVHSELYIFTPRRTVILTITANGSTFLDTGMKNNIIKKMVLKD